MFLQSACFPVFHSCLYQIEISLSIKLPFTLRTLPTPSQKKIETIRQKLLSTFITKYTYTHTFLSPKYKAQIFLRPVNTRYHPLLPPRSLCTFISPFSYIFLHLVLTSVSSILKCLSFFFNEFITLNSIYHLFVHLIAYLPFFSFITRLLK